MFPDKGENFGGLETLIGENNSSDSVDPHLRRDQLHTAHTTAKVDKVKDLESVFSPLILHLCQETPWTSAF